jgi:hypothetical protein
VLHIWSRAKLEIDELRVQHRAHRAEMIVIERERDWSKQQQQTTKQER